MSEEKFNPIETQEAFDKAIQARLDRQAHTLETKWSEEHAEALGKAEKYDELKTQYDDISSKYSALEESSKESSTKIADLENEVKSYKINEIKTKVAIEKGLSLQAIGRLQGETEEDIRKDADSLIGIIGKKKVPGKSHEEEPEDAKREALREALHKMGYDS